ncbi:MAG: hypothetical protein H7Y04_04200 [Verrucomicrobia bacterium]|nr:hypothetical protein [Cytophagales bacterium]
MQKKYFLLPIFIFCFYTSLHAQQVVGKASYFIGNQDYPCSGMAPIGNGEIITFVDTKRLTRLNAKLQTVWESEKLSSGRQYFGNPFTVGETVKTYFKDGKNNIYVQQIDFSGKVLAENKIYTPAGKNLSGIIGYKTAADGKSSMIYAFSGWRGEHVNYLYIHAATDSLTQGSFEVEEEKAEIQSIILTQDKIWTIVNTDNQKKRFVPVLHRYDISKQTTTSQALDLPPGKYTVLLRSHEERTYVLVYEDEEKTNKTANLFLYAFTDNPTTPLFKIRLPADKTEKFNTPEDIHFSDKGEIMVTTEPHYNSYHAGSTFVIAKNIYYYIYDKAGNFIKNGFIPKSQNQIAKGNTNGAGSGVLTGEGHAGISYQGKVYFIFNQEGKISELKQLKIVTVDFTGKQSKKLLVRQQPDAHFYLSKYLVHAYDDSIVIAGYTRALLVTGQAMYRISGGIGEPKSPAQP